MGKKIFLRLEGGLGNQLFQYSFASAIQHKYGGLVIIDAHAYKNDKLRKLSLDKIILNNSIVYNLNLVQTISLFVVRYSSRIIHRISMFVLKSYDLRVKILGKIGVYIQEKPNYYDYLSINTITPFVYIAGNWMSEKFFINYKTLILNELVMIKKSNNLISTQIKQANSVCVHIRRGDYTDPIWAPINMICDYNYFQDSMDLLSTLVSNPHFFIFSNSRSDIQWINDNYHFNRNVTYVDFDNSDIDDFYLMQKCKHFILSNSTYSWWASYLASNPSKIVVAPSKWNTGIWDQSDIFLPDWKLVKVK